jgi:hypothetical protein
LGSDKELDKACIHRNGQVAKPCLQTLALIKVCIYCTRIGTHTYCGRAAVSQIELQELVGVYCIQ